MGRACRTALALKNVLETARARGLDVVRVLRENPAAAAFPPEMEARVPMSVLYSVWESLLAQGATPAIAVHTASHASSSSRNLVRLVASASRTTGDAFSVAEHFWPLVTNAYGFRTRSDERELLLVFDPVPRRRGARLDLLFSLSSFIVYARAWTEQPELTAELLSSDDDWRAADVLEVEQALGVRLRAGEAIDGLRFEPALAARPLRHHDAGLFEYLRPQAERMLARLETDRPVTAQAWRLLDDVMPQRSPELAVARRLAMSPRSLRRKLESEDIDFSTLLDAYRARRARELLATADDDALAERLGFSNVRAFRRAFRRWHGKTPSQARG